jgi:hypothetical protein
LDYQEPQIDLDSEGMTNMDVKAFLAGLMLTVAATLGRAEAVDAPPAYYPQQAPVCYEDQVCHSCKLVPDKKQIKRPCYDVEETPYCLKKLPPFWKMFCTSGRECECCAECKDVRYKRTLVKKEEVVREFCCQKCVPEEHVERVPCQPCQSQCR